MLVNVEGCSDDIKRMVWGIMRLRLPQATNSQYALDEFNKHCGVGMHKVVTIGGRNTYLTTYNRVMPKAIPYSNLFNASKE